MDNNPGSKDLFESCEDSLLDNLQDYAIFFLDANGKIISWNKSAEKLMGYRAEDVVGTHFSILFSKEDVESGEPDDELKIALREGMYVKEGVMLRKDGSRFLAEIVTVSLRDSNGNLMGFAKIVRDITERRKLEIAKRRMKRALRVLCRVNGAIIHCERENELLNKACQIIVDEGGYRFAWIGYVTPDDIKPVAKAGEGDVELPDLSWNEDEGQRDLEGTADSAAIKTKKPILRDTRYGSAVSLPLVYKDEVFGVLNIYAGEKDVFDEDEVNLLKELAENLAFAIADHRARENAERVNKAMQFLLKLSTMEVDTNTLLHEALNEVVKLTDSKYGFFGEFGADDFRALVWSRDVMAECRRNEIHFQVSKGSLWAEAIKEGKTLIINQGEFRLPKGHVPINNFLAVPVFKNNTGFMIGLANKSSNYTKADAELTKFFAVNMQQILEKKRVDELQRTIIESTGTAMIIVKEDTTISYANRIAEKLFALPKERLLGKSWIEFTAKEDREKILRYHKLRRIDPKLAPKSYEVKLIDAKGRVKHVLLIISMMNPNMSLISLIDMTEMREAEKVIKESEMRYKLIFESSMDGIIIMDMDARIIDCNESALKILNTRREEITGRKFTEIGIIDEEDLPYFMERFYRGISEKKSEMELKVRVDGEIKWLEILLNLIEVDGKPDMILSIIRDITEKKLMEEKEKAYVRRLKILHELDKGILARKPLNESLKPVVESIRDFVRCDVVAILAYREDGLEAVATSSNIKSDEIDKILKMVRIEKTRVDDLLELNEFSELEKQLLRAGLTSYLCMPLMAKDEPVGVLFLASKRRKAFDEKMEFIVDISAQLAVALHEAILSEMRQRAFEQINDNIEKFAILVDKIRNPLFGISGIADTMISDERAKKLIKEQVDRILEIISALDEGWLESENIREFLKRGYGS
ncbi:PAS domain S-box [Archaeoglobus sulfaticallidus PM70-1]|uniref:PAS domain S-box n=1 Tax=Archaeoglobus sulfaticallidus PM70-1 TaxID=387631 RepID=N0BI45_9EURY|nr:PAS domain S-box protein [Archaeoglobus sulfaticallidus]AGK60116.1 PAS domain S-box [Archaeoglobus sulfaticallidus PM70-1]